MALNVANYTIDQVSKGEGKYYLTGKPSEILYKSIMQVRPNYSSKTIWRRGTMFFNGLKKRKIRV